MSYHNARRPPDPKPPRMPLLVKVLCVAVIVAAVGFLILTAPGTFR